MLLREKENLATELWKLRQQVEDLMNSKSDFGSELGGESAASGNLQQKLDSYRSDNPEPLQRKIGKVQVVLCCPMHCKSSLLVSQGVYRKTGTVLAVTPLFKPVISVEIHSGRWIPLKMSTIMASGQQRSGAIGGPKCAPFLLY